MIGLLLFVPFLYLWGGAHNECWPAGVPERGRPECSQAVVVPSAVAGYSLPLVTHGVLVPWVRSVDPPLPPVDRAAAVLRALHRSAPAD